jgi:hypothetical protein
MSKESKIYMGDPDDEEKYIPIGHLLECQEISCEEEKGIDQYVQGILGHAEITFPINFNWQPQPPIPDVIHWYPGVVDFLGIEWWAERIVLRGPGHKTRTGLEWDVKSMRTEWSRWWRRAGYSILRYFGLEKREGWKDAASSKD